MSESYFFDVLFLFLSL